MTDINVVENIVVPPAQPKALPNVNDEKSKITEVPENIKVGRDTLLKVLADIKDKEMRRNVSASPSYNKEFSVICKIIELNKLGDYVSINKDASLTYAKSKKNPFEENQRIKTTFGRYVRRVLSIKNNQIPDWVLDSITKIIDRKLLVAKDDEVKLLSGKDIQDFYKNTEITSCMTGGSSKLTEMYTLNPEKIQLAVYSYEDKVLARGLLWTCDDGSKVLDRVYPDGSKNIYALINWAANKGYDVKSNRINGKKCVTVKAENYVPYFDTFCYCSVDLKNKTYTLSNTSTKPTTRYVQDTLKYLSTNDCYYSAREKYVLPWVKTCKCNQCLKHGLEKEMKTISVGTKTQSYCSYCYKRYVKVCSCCKKQYILSYNACCANLCNKCTKKYAIRCSRCNTWVNIKDKKRKIFVVTKYGCSTKQHFCLNCVKYYCYTIVEEKNLKNKKVVAKKTTTKKSVKKSKKSS